MTFSWARFDVSKKANSVGDHGDVSPWGGFYPKPEGEDTDKPGNAGTLTKTIVPPMCAGSGESQGIVGVPSDPERKIRNLWTSQ
jgi:hypothetical protein